MFKNNNEVYLDIMDMLALSDDEDLDINDDLNTKLKKYYERPKRIKGAYDDDVDNDTLLAIANILNIGDEK